MAFFVVKNGEAFALADADLVHLPDGLDQAGIAAALSVENDDQDVAYHGTFSDLADIEEPPGTPTLWLVGAADDKTHKISGF